MRNDLAAAVEMEVSNVEAISEDGGTTWKAGGKGKISYFIKNNAIIAIDPVGICRNRLE